MKKWIAVCGRRLLCDGLNAFLDIAVIFTTERKRNVVNFYIFFIMKVFKNKNKIVIANFFKLSFAFVYS